MVYLRHMNRDTRDIVEALNFIKDRMLTKDDVREITREVIREEVPLMIEEALRPIYRELQFIRKDLDDLRERVDNMSGFSKEIDHALERITAIEKHLGIERKIAA